METFSALLAICAGNSPVPAQRPVTRSLDVFFDLCLNKRLSKQSWDWWFETPSCPLWRHYTDLTWLKYIRALCKCIYFWMQARQSISPWLYLKKTFIIFCILFLAKSTNPHLFIVLLFIQSVSGPAVISGMCLYQVSSNFLKYYDYPTSSTSGVVAGRRLEFPAVTFCNMNPVRNSQMNETVMVRTNIILVCMAFFYLVV